jgi:hypothetical protein
MTNKEIALITYKIIQKRKKRKENEKRLVEARATSVAIRGMERSMGRRIGQL